MSASRTTKAILLTASLAALSGCGTTRLTPEGEAVRVTPSPEVVQGCEYIGEVSASDKRNVGVRAMENTMRRLKNRTAEMGGNVALLAASNGFETGASALGEAYRCQDRDGS